MDYVLKCNDLNCRKDLTDIAVVTTCSHIFCRECARRLNLANGQRHQFLKCPACEQALDGPEDIVATNLNPSEEYKATVLSGLSPNSIMECAGRALNFWAYQKSQEIVFHTMQTRALMDKYHKLKGHLDTIVNDANNEISQLRFNLDHSTIEKQQLQKKNYDLINALKDKSRKASQTQELYERTKREGMANRIANAASEAVEHETEDNAMADVLVDHHGGSQNSNLIWGGQQRASMLPPPAPAMRTAMSGALGNLNGGNSTHSMLNTPSFNRHQRVAAERNIGLGRTMATPISLSKSPGGNLNPNYRTSAGMSGYGLSAGLKISQTPIPHGTPSTRFGCSRVVQRPVSTAFTGNRPTNVGSGLFTNINNY